MPIHRLLAAAASLVVVLASLPSLAQKPAAPQGQSKQSPAQPHRLGEAQSWSAYTYASGNGKVCYLVGTPAKSEPASAKRDAVNALVTHNTADKTSNVVSFVAGYTLKEKSDVDLEIDNKKFSLFTNNDTAWARDAATDKAIADAMAKGKQAVVKGTSSRGTATTDTYSLAGFGQALALIDKACGVKR
jgi:invasion protein IalB